MRQIDVSELAALGALGLLAGKIRILLERYAGDPALTPTDVGNLDQARQLLSEALEGIQELQRFQAEMVFGADKLDAVLTLRTASQALSPRQTTEPPDEDLRALQGRLQPVVNTLTALQARDPVAPESLREADDLFSALCSYAAEKRRSISRTGSEIAA